MYYRKTSEPLTSDISGRYFLRAAIMDFVASAGQRARTARDIELLMGFPNHLLDDIGLRRDQIGTVLRGEMQNR